MLTLLTAALAAPPITVEIEARIVDVDIDDAFERQAFPVGARLTMTYTFDPDVMDSDVRTRLGQYTFFGAPSRVVVQVADQLFESAPGAGFEVFTQDGLPPALDAFSLSAEGSRSLAGSATPPEVIVFALNDRTSTAQVTDALPLGAPDLSAWDRPLLQLLWWSLGWYVDLDVVAARVVPSAQVLGVRGAHDVLGTGFTPGGTVLALHASWHGDAPVPAGICAGADTRLFRPALGRTLTAGPLGTIVVQGIPNLPSDRRVVLFDVGTCAASPVSLAP